MFMEKEISIYDFVCAISEAVDLVSPALNSHHKKVAYIACSIGLEMELPNEEMKDIILASMLHDIGAFSIDDRMKTLRFEGYDPLGDQHGLLGYKLLKDFEPLSNAAALIRYHHADYDASRNDIPMGSYIINLADRAAVLIKEKMEILAQVPKVVEKMCLRYHRFHPDAFKAFVRAARLEYVWFEAFSSSYNAVMLKRVQFPKKIIDLETLRNFAKVIAQIIDFRSRFTATHSSGVAAVARELTFISGFSERECKLMEIAGFLHDLGKLAVPNSILEKKGKLDREEFYSIKKHTYYTFAILSRISGMENIAAWAAYHHERQDGNGYPFHVKGKNFPRLSQVMVVADVVTALTEDRPYRAGMEMERASEILYAMAESGGVDKNIVDLAHKNFFRINDVRIKAQKNAQREYEAFHNTGQKAFAANTVLSA
jgi:HD-GYP domain-containing protein (c-di-GMP phosphodiesterase class II)